MHMSNIGVTMSNEKELDGATVRNGSYGNGHQAGQQNGDQNGHQYAKAQNGKHQTVHVNSVGSTQSRSAAGPSRNRGSILGNFLKLRSLSKRPLPTEMGDGTYRQVVQRPGLRADLATVSLAGE